MNLLIEQTDVQLTESKITGSGEDRKYIIEGIFLQSNVKNANNRIYPESVMDREVNKYIAEKLVTSRAVGELEHPEDGRSQSINLRFVSHKITELTKKGTDWWGRAEITKKTPMGAIVVGLMEAGVVLGTSSRVRGSVKRQNGVDIVQNDFSLITPTDIVSDPSAPDAIVTSIMENKEWIFENGVLVEKDIDEVQKMVNTSIRNNCYDEKALFNSILAKLK